MINQLDLWNKVDTPDPKYTKKVSMRGGFTSVSPQYMIKLATQQFGSYGKGFGLSVSNMDFSLVGEFRVVLHNAVFFYISEGSRNEFPITNTIEIVSKNGNVDTDFAKKLETNTVSKALSKLGFAADVYMGMFDDGEYVNDITNEQKIKDASDKDLERARQASELLDDANKVIVQIGEVSTVSALEGLYKSMVRRIGNKDAKLLRKLESAKDKAKERLAESDNETV
jgi:hypothetical protein